MTHPDNLLDRLEALLASATAEAFDNGEVNAALSVALVNAAPALIRLARAAEAWRDSRCERLSGCDPYDSTHDNECPIPRSERALVAALDAFNGGKP